MLPQQEFHLNSFGYPFYDSDLDASAVYSGSISDNRRYFGMALVSLRDSAEAVTQRVVDNQLIGYKPYFEFVEGKPKDQITIEDMLPAGQMQVADEFDAAIKQIEVAGDGPRIFEKPLPFMGGYSPAVLTCAAQPGPAVFVNLAPGPEDTFSLIVARLKSSPKTNRLIRPCATSCASGYALGAA
jgi:hypothetical protein